MKIQYIIGADVSKSWIDLACHQPKNHFQIENSITGFQQLLQWLRDRQIRPSVVIIVMEHTGLYSYQMEAFLHQHHISFTKVPALAIKRSLGLVRGKTDKIDAERIARYGFEKRDRLTMAIKPDASLQRLQMLNATRERLVKHRASLICALKEYKVILSETDIIITSQLALIKNLSQQIKLIETEIKEIVHLQQSIKQNFQLLNSLKGVGPVLAVATIIKTRNFQLFTNARKFACYCGVAPFEHESGKTIRRKPRVSHLADKRMKTLLDLSAKSAIQYDKELSAFYKRRLEMGKSKKSTINIVRNKIIYRMFAVIKRQTPFIENYLQTA